MVGHATKFTQVGNGDITAPMTEHTIRPPDVIDLAEDTWSHVASESEARIYALSTRILTVSNLVEMSFEGECARHGLNSGETLVLDALFRMGAPYEASPARLKAHFFISFAGIGKRLARLEALGLIERRINALDRRGQIVRLTKAGLELQQRSSAHNEAPHVLALKRMPPQDLSKLAELLKALQGVLEEELARE